MPSGHTMIAAARRQKRRRDAPISRTTLGISSERNRRILAAAEAYEARAAERRPLLIAAARKQLANTPTPLRAAA